MQTAKYFFGIMFLIVFSIVSWYALLVLSVIAFVFVLAKTSSTVTDVMNEVEAYT